MDRTTFERVVARVLLGALAVACLWVIAPFLRAATWATITVVATWPILLRLRPHLGNRRRLAAFVMTAALALAFVLPVVVVVVSLAGSVQALTTAAADLTTLRVPDAPLWLPSLPLVGPRIARAWSRAQADTEGTLALLQPYVRTAALWILAQGAKLVGVIVEFLLALVLAGVLYAHGEQAVAMLRRAAGRLAGASGLVLIDVSERTIRSVSAGVIGTALVQAVLSAISFAVVGMPGVPLLGMISFVFATLQMGTAPVWLPATAWLAWQGRTGAAVFIAVSGIFINIVDNFIKPLLMGRRDDGAPTTLIFVGVLGGMIAWGFIGVFLGSTLIALGYTLLRAWLQESSGVEREPEPFASVSKP